MDSYQGSDGVALEDVIQRHTTPSAATGGAAVFGGTGTATPAVEAKIDATGAYNRTTTEIHIPDATRPYSFTVSLVGSPARGLYWNNRCDTPTVIRPQGGWTYTAAAATSTAASDDSDGIDGTFTFTFQYTPPLAVRRTQPAGNNFALSALSFYRRADVRYVYVRCM